MTQPSPLLNFDGLIGPTHNFSGLSPGNIASLENKDTLSNPKAAALEGLEKMNLLYQAGLNQAVLPPNERPHIPTLRALGFSGSDKSILNECAGKYPELIPSITSAACMFTANSGTFAPSADTLDSKVHITPANLISKLHRAIEAPFTYQILKKIFSNESYFTIHNPLPPYRQFSDEGSANHIRFSKDPYLPGMHLFVYGQSALTPNALLPSKFPARQTLEASQSVARFHKLLEEHIIYAQQNPRAIDAGVFHNDVISLGSGLFFMYHEDSFVSTDNLLEQMQKKSRGLFNAPLVECRVNASQVSLEDAVATYLFNSQIAPQPDGNMVFFAPKQCQDNPNTKLFLDSLLQDPKVPINNVIYINLTQSMRNGGGPACLRFNLSLTPSELLSIHQGVLFSDIRYKQLKEWINKHYRDMLKTSDLADPELLRETHAALDELTQILKLGSIYSFQKTAET
ncbi:MAG: N-succinylarginine dihydrolase [Parachlamydiales bacterium]|jgi:succinylarginine dihydrolase